ncbi:MAG TPA: SDR family oxidoreductase [Solirubrobacteraceae bacterium]|nr:SDR family oxidoreductase [Solirubrobacteraceae bacterium]
MAYFVTGATGFIGRHLVERLLEREGDVHVLVRAGSQERLNALVERWGEAAAGRVKPVVGDLGEPRLGLSDEQVAALRAQIEHFFHLAAIYDMTARADLNERLNVVGTRNALDVAGALQAERLHHVSSVAAAGDYKGLFREDMFDEGQTLPSPYHRTKFESEKLVREQSPVPWRIYRPAIVVGHSQTGQIDKIDGPYYFFKAIQKARFALPEWVPLVGPELGYTNIVPVDFVAAALDHIAHQTGLDGQAFHLTNPKPMRVGESLNAFAKAAHAPQLAIRVDKRLTDALPKGTLSMLMKLPQVRDIRRTVLADFGIPEEVLEHMALRPQFDTRNTERALAGSGIAVPELETYAHRLWDHWERTLDPDLYKDRSFRHVINGRTVIITGASSGIGRATALKVAASGGIPLLVARGLEKLEALREEIGAKGGTAHVYSADLSNMDAIDAVVARILDEHPAVDFLVNNAGRSIRRSIKLSEDRFHDFERTMQLNYFGAIKMIMALLPHMRERGSGHIVNVSSIGVQTNPPRFSAYVASKAALDAWTRVVSSEVIGDGITFTTIHMQLVRTPMIAPTKLYDHFPTISPEEAGDLICEAMRTRPKEINTRLGTAGEILHALAPKVMDQILHVAYNVFPDSAASKGEKAPADAERASMEQLAMANIMKGVHW